MAESNVQLSICMVSLNCWNVLQDCLRTLEEACAGIAYEVIVVDNGSVDGTPGKVQAQFPYCRVVVNSANVGFTKATNQGIRLSRGRYLLWLNTDTVLRPNSLSLLCRQLDLNPKVGIVGPRVFNPDGSFQPECRRGLPTPFASLCHLLRLDQFLSDSPTIGQYHMTYLPVDLAHEVTAVTGCCLLARREVWNEIGPLDEQCFAYGEDIDWCLRAKQAGWQIWYRPESQIIHLKGQGGAHFAPYRKVSAQHDYMWLFFKKHFGRTALPSTSFFVWLGIKLSFAVRMLSAFRKQVWAAWKR